MLTHTHIRSSIAQAEDCTDQRKRPPESSVRRRETRCACLRSFVRTCASRRTNERASERTSARRRLGRSQCRPPPYAVKVAASNFSPTCSEPLSQSAKESERICLPRDHDHRRRHHRHRHNYHQFGNTTTTTPSSIKKTPPNPHSTPLPVVISTANALPIK